MVILRLLLETTVLIKTPKAYGIPDTVSAPNPPIPKACEAVACAGSGGMCTVQEVLQFEQPMVPVQCRMTGPLLISVEKIQLSSDLHGWSPTS